MSGIRAGFVGFGEINSPRDVIERKCADAAARLCQAGVALVTTAPVSDDPGGKDAARAAAELAREPFDCLVVCIAGWIPSYAVIAVIDRFRHLPMVLWGLAGSIENGRLITTADQAGTTALRQAMCDMGFRVTFVWDTIDGGSKAQQVVCIARAASTAVALRGARIGMMGNRDMNLYGTAYDPAWLRGGVGCEIEHFEMLEMERASNAFTTSEISE